MYLKHVCLYKRRSNVKNSKRRLTLTHFDAILRCDALILKMARLRFPGRPGQRIGKNYVKYVYDDVKTNMDVCLPVHTKIEIGLKIFYEFFGYSDEEEEFEGFTKEDLVQAEVVCARSLRTKAAIERYVETNQEPSSSAASDIEKIFSSSDSETSTPAFVQNRRGMRNVIRRSYDQMLKYGLCDELVHRNSLYSHKSKSCIKSKPKTNDSVHIKAPVTQDKTDSVKSDTVNISVVQTNDKEINEQLQNYPQKASKKYFMQHLLAKAKRLQSRQKRKSVRPNVKKKIKSRFTYSTSRKYSKNIPKKTRSNQPSQISNPELYHKSFRNSKLEAEINSLIEPTSSTQGISEVISRPKHSMPVRSVLPSSSSQSSKSETRAISDVSHSQVLSDGRISKSKNLLGVGRKRKRFILPSMSARSSRKIIPRRRYMDSLEPLSSKIVNEDSHGSSSALSGSSEAISAMDGESSPDDTHPEVENSQNSLKKIGLLDQPLLVEGKRPWKPSLKVQMKLSQMNYDYPFALKKNADGSSGTSSGSFKDIIKPDMVSKYAEKMAQKPKEKLPKLLEGARKAPIHKNESEKVENDSSDVFEDNKKPEDKLEKVAAKIEKLLKSQWEGRLQDPSKKQIPSEIMAQWKTEQQQRSSNQRRTKHILRKARLQLKRRNLRSRQSAKESPISRVAVQVAQNILSVRSPVDQVDVPLQNVLNSSCTSDIVSDTNCVICGSSKLYFSPTKLYEELACGPCNGFFEKFLKTPKQYFCKDGKCSINNKDAMPRRASNGRCKACWIKACIENLTVSVTIRDRLKKHIPRLKAPPHNPLFTDTGQEIKEEKDEDVINEKEVVARGPRIKHVCRRAAVVLGLPRATFADVAESQESFNLSALPKEEKQKILDTVPAEEIKESVETESKPATFPVKTPKVPEKKKVHKDIKVKNRVHLDLLKKSAFLIQKEQKKKKLQMKKSLKQLHKQSVKKSLKLSKRNQMKKTVKFSYKSAVKTSLKTSPKGLQKRPVKPKLRKVRCKECEGCLAKDCGDCAYCLDKKKFGGPNLIKQACMFRRCVRPVLPASERKASKMSFSIHIDKGKPSGGPPSFGGDGPSGIGTSPTSSSSSPSSPDGSSCGSSCTSSSSTSSSGSSNSSSSSSSSTSTSSSSSDNLSISTNPLLNNCVESSLMPNFESQSVILHQSECTDNNVTIFPGSMYSGENFASEPTLHDLLSQKAFYADGILDVIDYKESVDTILYEDSSSIIELKNASIAPSLMYCAALGDGVVTCSADSRKQNSQQSRSYGKRKIVEKDQYGSAGSGSNEDDNDEDDDDDDDEEKKKHFILADYWEDYDSERISSQGYSLIYSHPPAVPCVCYLCGSAGMEKLIFCVLCCEPYHTFCLSDDDVPYEENIENWCCRKCQCCAVCGLKNNLLKCKVCQNTYHAECFSPLYPTKLSRKKRIWVCPKCVKCKSCGATSHNGNGQIWNFDTLLCQSCSKLTDKGNYCPVCRKCYEENDYESEMVQCSKCDRWVHATCDDMSGEDYEILSCLPDSVVYTCGPCNHERIPKWKAAISEYRDSGLKVILNSLLYSRCARYLIKQDDIPKKGSSYLNCDFIQNQSSNQVSERINNPCVLPSSVINDSAPNKDSSELLEDSEKHEEILNLISELITAVDAPTSSSEICPSSSCIGTDFVNKEIIKNKSCSVTCIDVASISYKVENKKYKSIISFFTDVINVLERGRNDFNKLHIWEAKRIITAQLEKTFDFFEIPVIEIWTNRGDYPPGMLPQAVLPPSEDHIYSQYLERKEIMEPLNLPESNNTIEIRSCVLCGYTGDSIPKKCGRLLYCGQDDWIHVNCAMWSAEVFQQQDGSLRNVYPAIARGKLMICVFCNQLGATVGCCVRGCPANYHFYCARKDEALLQEDKKVFCALHKENVDAKVMKDDDFVMSKKTFVHHSSIAPKWVKNTWQESKDIGDIRVQIGSLTVHKLGNLISLSDKKTVLVPVNYECSRMFWSTRNPRVQVKYTCRIIEIRPDKEVHNPDLERNTTIVHEAVPMKEEAMEVSPEAVLSSLDSRKNTENNKGVSSFESLEIHNAIINDVIKVVQRLIKKVIKRQKKYWEKVRTKFCIHSDKVLGCENNSLDHQSNDCVSKLNHESNVHTNKKLLENCCNKANRLPFDKGIELNNNSNCLREQQTSLYDDFTKSFIAPINNNDKNCLQSKNSYSEIFKKYVQTSILKDLKKKLKHCLISKQHFDISEKLIDLIADKEIAKEVSEVVLKRYKNIDDLPPKLLTLLESVLPPCYVNETVLPVFFSKENSGINESSGYSSNDDSHLRPPAHGQTIRSENMSLNEISLRGNSKQRKAEIEKSEASWMKDIKLNGRKTFNRNGESNSSRSNGSNPDGSHNSANLLEHAANKIKTFNGVSQDAGPFKCTKCKRLYRTNESFEKHSESCNFFVDSSSTEEESSDSSDGSEESYDSSSNEAIPNELNRIPLKKSLNHSVITNKEFTVNKVSETGFRSEFLNQKLGGKKNANVPSVPQSGRIENSEMSYKGEFLSQKLAARNSLNMSGAQSDEKENAQTVYKGEFLRQKLAAKNSSSVPTVQFDQKGNMETGYKGEFLSQKLAAKNNSDLSGVQSNIKETGYRGEFLSQKLALKNSSSVPAVQSDQIEIIDNNGYKGEFLSQKLAARNASVAQSDQKGTVQTGYKGEFLNQKLAEKNTSNFSGLQVNQPTNVESGYKGEFLSQKLAAKSTPNVPVENSVPPQKLNYLPNPGLSIQFPQQQNVNVSHQQTLNSGPNIQFRQVIPSNRVISNSSMNIDNATLNTNALPNNFNVGFSNTLCNNTPSGLVQMPCNTVIIPPAPEPVQPSHPILHIPQNNFYNAPLELASNASAQLSYVGSITVTNNDAMSFSVNMPDQMMQVFPQPNINFGQNTIIPNPLQMQQTGIQLSALNIQQISLQGAFSANPLNPFMFQQGVNIPQNQVMFIEEPISHSLSTSAQSPNFVFQVPVGQAGNTFPFVPQQQFVSQVAFNSGAQNIASNVLSDQSKRLFPQENNLQRPDSVMPVLTPAIDTNNNANQRSLHNIKLIKPAVISPEPVYSPKCAAPNSTPSNSSCTTTPSVSSRSTPVPDCQTNIQSLSIPPDSPIMDFLKKAAEQVLSLTEKRKAQSQDQNSDSGAPEKKTRFAHTRKVAARRAEKLRLRKNAEIVVSKPKTVQLNIATLTSFPIPVVPVASESFPEPPKQQSPVPEASHVEQISDNCERSRRECSKFVYYKDESDDDLIYKEESDEDDSILLRIQKNETKNSNEIGGKKPHIIYEIFSEDGFSVQSHNIKEAWEKVYDTLQDSRIANFMRQLPISPQEIDGYHMMGLDNEALIYLVEQLPGAEKCKYYDFIFHKPTKENKELLENTTGCARSEPFSGRSEYYDMFNFLASEHRLRPIFVPPEEEDEGTLKTSRRSTILDIPIAFKNLKTVARETVGVYRSSIHGRGLFCKRNIDAGELVIEYAGEVIRSVLTDKREKIYQSRGIGCYMFKIDDEEVVDATMHGNAARFINHSCEPNCFSKVITVDGKKHIVIFALRRISKGEELTYDYKFPFEEEKIPCHCNTRKCRKYLN